MFSPLSWRLSPPTVKVFSSLCGGFSSPHPLGFLTKTLTSSSTFTRVTTKTLPFPHLNRPPPPFTVFPPPFAQPTAHLRPEAFTAYETRSFSPRSTMAGLSPSSSSTFHSLACFSDWGLALLQEIDSLQSESLSSPSRPPTEPPLSRSEKGLGESVTFANPLNFRLSVVDSHLSSLATIRPPPKPPWPFFCETTSSLANPVSGGFAFPLISALAL